MIPIQSEYEEVNRRLGLQSSLLARLSALSELSRLSTNMLGRSQGATTMSIGLSLRWKQPVNGLLLILTWLARWMPLFSSTARHCAGFRESQSATSKIAPHLRPLPHPLNTELITLLGPKLLEIQQHINAPSNEVDEVNKVVRDINVRSSAVSCFAAFLQACGSRR